MEEQFNATLNVMYSFQEMPLRCSLCGYPLNVGTHLQVRRVGGQECDDWSDASGAEWVCTVPINVRIPSRCARIDGITT